MTTKTRLTIVGVALLVGLLALIGVALWTLDQVRVNGPLYARIVQAKDLVADILPPPEYALEAHDLSMSSTTKQAADSAQQASVLATNASGAATDGSAAMERSCARRVPQGMGPDRGPLE